VGIDGNGDGLPGDHLPENARISFRLHDDFHASSRVCVLLRSGTPTGHVYALSLERLAFHPYVRMPSLAVGTRISHSGLGEGIPQGIF